MKRQATTVNADEKCQKMLTGHQNYFLKRFYLFILGRGREGEREEENH